MSVCFFFLFNSQAHYLDKIVKGTVYLLFDDMPIPTCTFLYEYIVTNVLVWTKESSLTYIPWIIDLTHVTFNSSQIKNEILLT